jgi:hypothetical protein
MDYAKNPNDERFEKILLEKSRKFLKKSAENQFEGMDQVGLLISEESKKFIEECTLCL